MVIAPLHLLLAGAVAEAVECTESYSVDTMLQDMLAVETFLRNGDDPNAGKAAAALSMGVVCMDEVLPRRIIGRVVRAIAAGYVTGGDTDTAEQWLRTSVEVEPSFEFGIEDLPLEHPLRLSYQNVYNASGGEPVLVDGASLATGTVYLDGKAITEPEARLDRWHVLQFDNGAGIRSWMIEGNQFPDDVLVSVAAVAESKKPKREKPPKEERVPKESVASVRPTPVPINNTITGVRDRPWEKTPLMIGGGAVVVGAGAVYYLSYLGRREFDTAEDDGVLLGLQKQTNRLFIASYAVLAVGAGTFTWGAILDGGHTPLPAVRVRF